LAIRRKYDGANRRIRIFSDFNGSTPGMVQDDYHNGQQVIESRFGEDGQPTGGHQYLWSPRYIDSPILRDTLDSGGEIVAAERILYLSDANYNVTGLVKYNSGESAWRVVERYSYTPYGVATFRDADWTAYAGPNPQSQYSNTTLYTGRAWDALISLYFYRARFHDAVLERFVARDPIGYGADINLYRYCDNQPVIIVDPSGLWDEGWFHDGVKKPNCSSGNRGHGNMPGSVEQGGDFDWNREDRIHDPFDPYYTSRHFRTLREVEEDLVKAVCKCNQYDFEIYGHQMQDWFSHRGQGYEGWDWGSSAIGTGVGTIIPIPGVGTLGGGIVGGWGHGRGNVLGWVGGLRPDNADDYNDAFIEAEIRTKYWIKRWNACCRGVVAEPPFDDRFTIPWCTEPKKPEKIWVKKDLTAREGMACCAPVNYEAERYKWVDKAPPGKRIGSP
jgi:RHS repeat-associated protein